MRIREEIRIFSLLALPFIVEFITKPEFRFFSSPVSFFARFVSFFTSFLFSHGNFHAALTEHFHAVYTFRTPNTEPHSITGHLLR